MSAVNGCVAFITGAASGLGKATLKHLLTKGARGVYCFDTQAFPEEVGKSDNFASYRGDVRSEENVSAALEECYKKFGKIDTVVNCAGVSVAFRLFNFKKNRAHDLKDFADVFQVNCLGTFNVNRLAAGYLYKNTPDEANGLRGLIINTSGNAAFDGQIGQAAYSAAAGAINSMTLPLARDLGVVGIRCLTISCGYFKTPLLAHLPKNILEFLENSTLCPKRLGEPTDYARLVEAIMDNEYLNATVIKLDGGMRMFL